MSHSRQRHHQLVTQGPSEHWGSGDMHAGVARPWDNRRENAKGARNGVMLDVGGYGIAKTGSGSAREDNGVAQVGEDAYFVRKNAMGVADGVGGWAKSTKGKERATEQSGSAVFAHRLMSAVAEEADLIPPPRPSNFLGMLDPKWGALEELEEAIDVLKMLEHAYSKAITPPPPPGSSTALVAVLSPAPPPSPYSFLLPPHIEADCTLKIAHVGDCVALLIRDSDVVFRSQEMWWAFNTPVQLGPKAPLSPTTAQTFSVPVSEGDLLILATDGLSDNLWDEDIMDEVHKWRSTADGEDGALDVNVLSQALCSRARSVATDPKADTPFARRAREEGKRFSGGKKDDVSVVVALIARPAS
ncbi:protein serine/threonine phosphatase 2C [Cylindrobasidium torrendii FP15055 ss-10]|uniref:Protein phosphatase n=1 Tax=Cylindrobasidium torrendii FP15055 ss-10 TaxID=1314674 RepID=A0A0D7B252_9AGAR|nr:protein serine/threonine phosphatase 2C [Cylindrobasidium torrendii FP15055 ss-10]